MFWKPIFNKQTFSRRLNKYLKSKAVSKLFIDSSNSILGAVFSKGGLFIIFVIIARMLGPELYGKFGVIRSTLIMFINFAGFGLGITANKFVAEYYVEDKTKVGNIIGLTLSFGLLMGLFSSIIVYFASLFLAKYMEAPELDYFFKLCSIILIISSINGAQLGVMQGLRKFDKVLKASILQISLAGPIFLILTYLLALNGAVYGLIIYYLVITIVLSIELKNEIGKQHLSISIRQFLNDIPILYKFSLPAFLSGFILIPFKWVSDAQLVTIENGFQNMGLFSAAINFQAVVLMGANMLNAPFLSSLSRAQDNSNKDNIILNKLNIIIPFGIGLFVTAPFILIPEIASLLFGKEYDGSEFDYTFITVCVFTLVLMYKQGFSRLLAVYNMQWWSFLSNLVWGFTLIITFSYLKVHGAIGLAFSYLVAYIVNTMIFIPLYIWKKMVPKKYFIDLRIVLIWIVVFASPFIYYFLDEFLLLRVFLSLLLLSIYIILLKSFFYEKNINYWRV